MPRQIVFLLSLLLSVCVCAREKTDIITLKNGDVVTGKIKALERGLLRFSSVSMQTIMIEWRDVDKITSQYEFQFETASGIRLKGYIENDPDESGINRIRVTGKSQTMVLAYQRVVRITPLDDNFWQNLDGSISFGYSNTKSTGLTQLNFSSDTAYRTEKRLYRLEMSTLTTDSDSGHKQRSTGLFNVSRFHSKRWFNGYGGTLERNDELGLELRTAVNADVGRYLVQTNEWELMVSGGLAGTRENLLNTMDIRYSAEGQGTLRFTRYVYHGLNSNISAAVIVFPSITEKDRLRSQLDISVRQEIVKDFFLDLSYYFSYDNSPAEDATSTEDYALIVSVGYSY